MENQEKKYTGYGYHGGGRKPKGTEAKTKTMSIVGTETEINKIKEMAKEQNKTVSRLVIDTILEEK